MGNTTVGVADNAAGASGACPVRGAFVDDGMPMLFVEADGVAVDAAADASDATLAVDVAPVDDGILIPISADDADVILADDVAPVDDMMLVPLSAVDADGATGIMIPMLVGGADVATVDDGSGDDAGGASIDEEISV